MDKHVPKVLQEWSDKTADYLNKSAELLNVVPEQIRDEFVHVLKVLKFYKVNLDKTLSTVNMQTTPVEEPLPSNVVKLNSKGRRPLEMD
jgi:hypothetical protein